MKFSILQISNNLVANAIWSIISFIAGFMGSRFWDYKKNKPVKKFWQSILSDSAVIIAPNPRSKRPGQEPSGWDTVGLAHLIHSVTSILPIQKLTFVPSSFTSGEMMSKNLILIASPYSNKHVADIFASSKITTKSKFESNVLYFENLKYQYTYDNTTNEGIDYALILVIPNPYNSNKSAVILAGCRGFGTFEAQKFVDSSKNLRKILKGRKKIGEIILRVTVKQNWPVHSEVLHIV